jgi:hypothetical protein
LLGIDVVTFEIGAIDKGEFYVKFHLCNKVSDSYEHRWPFLFNSVIDGLNLRELKMSSRRFTWTNSMPNPTYEKLDRILVSTEWEQKFPLAKVMPLSRDISYHTHLLLDIGRAPSNGNQP